MDPEGFALPPSGTESVQPGMEPVPPAHPDRSSNKKVIIALIVVIILLVSGLAWVLFKPAKPVQTAQTHADTAAKSAADTTAVKGVQLDPNKDYGNKYADGLLPVGDGKYTTSGAQKGSVYACDKYAQNLVQTAGGAGKRGPWFVNHNTQYDINKKTAVQGSIHWDGSFSNTMSGDIRTIVTNDLPGSHTTGIFPISRNDPAHVYDANPNTITSQDLVYKLDATPTYGDPQCESGDVGVMLTGVALFNGLDAGGRDAGAWEVQDSCQGHPQVTGEYHYHTLSSCIKDTSVKTVIGFALDGFPITGPKVGTNNYLTTSDLDECHGLTSEVSLDGKTVTTYHYVMTQDYPYSVSCFRAKPIAPPGQQASKQDPHQHP